MGWNGGGDLLLTTGKHGTHLLTNGASIEIVKSLVNDIIEELGNADFDDFDSYVGHWDILDECLQESGVVRPRIDDPDGEHEMKFYLGSGEEWAVYYDLVDRGIVSENYDYGWLKYRATEVATTIVVDFDNEEVYLTHIEGVKLPNRVKV